MARALKWRVRATRDLLGYVYAHSEFEAWQKAKAKFGELLVQSVELV